MAISVKDIQEKVFPTQPTGGYNIEQVDDFLDEISGQLGALVRENIALNSELSKLSDALEEKERALAEAQAKTPDYNEAGYFRNLESAMRESLIGAQRLADETSAAAKAEADRMVQEATDEAAKLRADAKAEAAAVTERAASDAAAAKAELDELKSSIESYRAACRKLIEEQLQTLKANDLLFK